MKVTNKKLILAFLLGAFMATLGWEINDADLVLRDTDKAKVIEIVRDDIGWRYSFQLNSHQRFAIRSYKPLGYQRGDKIRVYELFNTIYQYRTYRLIQARLVDSKYMAHVNLKGDISYGR